MLISPPFLPNHEADQTDAAWLNLAMTGVAPAFVPAIGNGTIAGSYPISMELGWHGGMHLVAPRGANDVAMPVRAIADGQVIYVRAPKAQNADADDALNYGAPAGSRCWTSDGVVLIRHETEIGATAAGQAVSVVFYSLYMHLDTIAEGVAAGRRRYRKEEIGSAGYIYGQPNRIHFEIFCDSDNLQALIGRSSGELPTGDNGRASVIIGELYFHLPTGTQLYAQRPPANQITATATAAHITTADLVIGVRYAQGEGPAGERGHAFVTTYHPDGAPEGDALPETDAEYNLYTTANAISSSYPADARPAPSAVYELLRFGRVINTEQETLTPADVPHWRQVRFPGGQAWANLNATDVRQFSDGDFPHWKGWRLIDDSADRDSRCDSSIIRGWLDSNNDQRIGRAEAATSLGTTAIARNLEHAICRFPSEWRANTIDQRWGWLKDSTEENPDPLSADDFKDFKAHAEALCFWDDVPAQTPALPDNPWRFHPREFVRVFRRCGWLSAEELARVYPDTIYPVTALAQIDRTPTIVREGYRHQVNRLMEKYFVTTPSRRTHFYGQGAVESLALALMVEGAANFSRNPLHASFASEADGYYSPTNPGNYLYYLEGRLGNIETGDGPKFRGRGMKQLTGRENYSKYWVYRGWLDPNSFISPWWNPTRIERAPIIDAPQQLSISPFNAIDAGGWYWEAGSRPAGFHSINRSVTENNITTATIRVVTYSINGGYGNIEERIAHTIRVSRILSDESI